VTAFCSVTLRRQFTHKLLKLAGAIGNNGPDEFVVGNPADQRII